jgi:hypothetical protein
LLKRAQLFGDLVFLAGNPLPYPERMATRQQQERLLRLRAGDARASTAISSTAIGSQAAWRGIFVTLLPRANQPCSPVGTTNNTHEAAMCVDIPPANGAASALIEVRQPGATATDLLPAARALRRIPKAARRYYGTPIRAYIRYLVRRFDRLPSKITKLKARFRDLERSQKLKYASFPMTDCFVLLYAGGCLAIESGVLPWKEAHLHAALHECLIAAIKHQHAGQLGPKAIRRILGQHLRAANVVPRELHRPFGPDRHDGFYEFVGGRRRYTIHAKAFRRWFGGSTRCAASLAWLHKKGLLVMGDKRAVPNSTSADWAERTPRWPDGRVQKSFVFYEMLPSPPAANAINGR